MVSLTEILEIYIIRFWVQSFGFVPFCILNNLTVQSRCVKIPSLTVQEQRKSRKPLFYNGFRDFLARFELW